MGSRSSATGRDHPSPTRALAGVGPPDPPTLPAGGTVSAVTAAHAAAAGSRCPFARTASSRWQSGRRPPTRADTGSTRDHPLRFDGTAAVRGLPTPSSAVARPCGAMASLPPANGRRSRNFRSHTSATTLFVRSTPSRGHFSAACAREAINRCRTASDHRYTCRCMPGEPTTPSLLPPVADPVHRDVGKPGPLRPALSSPPGFG